LDAALRVGWVFNSDVASVNGNARLLGDLTSSGVDASGGVAEIRSNTRNLCESVTNGVGTVETVALVGLSIGGTVAISASRSWLRDTLSIVWVASGDVTSIQLASNNWCSDTVSGDRVAKVGDTSVGIGASGDVSDTVSVGWIATRFVAESESGVLWLANRGVLANSSDTGSTDTQVTVGGANDWPVLPSGCWIANERIASTVGESGGGGDGIALGCGVVTSVSGASIAGWAHSDSVLPCWNSIEANLLSAERALEVDVVCALVVGTSGGLAKAGVSDTSVGV